MTLYRKCRFGRLADFFVLDTRQYRTDQPNGDRQKPMTGKVFDPQATMLGRKQENWLMSGLLQTDSTWNALAQQVMMAALNRGDEKGERYSMDQWPGYEVSRREAPALLPRAENPQPSGPDRGHPPQLGQQPSARLQGSEVPPRRYGVGGHLHVFLRQRGQLHPRVRAGRQTERLRPVVQLQPRVRQLRTDPQGVETYFRATPRNEERRPIETKAVFMIEEGKPGAQLCFRGLEGSP